MRRCGCSGLCGLRGDAHAQSIRGWLPASGQVDPSNMRLATFADGLRSKGYAAARKSRSWSGRESIRRMRSTRAS